MTNLNPKAEDANLYDKLDGGDGEQAQGTDQPAEQLKSRFQKAGDVFEHDRVPATKISPQTQEGEGPRNCIILDITSYEDNVYFRLGEKGWMHSYNLVTKEEKTWREANEDVN